MYGIWELLTFFSEHYFHSLFNKCVRSNVNMNLNCRGWSSVSFSSCSCLTPAVNLSPSQMCVGSLGSTAAARVGSLHSAAPPHCQPGVSPSNGAGSSLLTAACQTRSSRCSNTPLRLLTVPFVGSTSAALTSTDLRAGFVRGAVLFSRCTNGVAPAGFRERAGQERLWAGHTAHRDAAECGGWAGQRAEDAGQECVQLGLQQR